MKRKLRCSYLSLLFLLIGSAAYPQWQNGLWTGKQANNWYFYFYTGLNFNTSPPSQIMDSMFDDWFLENESGFEGSGAISDSNGTILFYTNGDAIWNSNNELMVNGYDLLGETTANQSGLVIPVPGTSDRYYVFSADGTPSPETVLAYSEVDMSLNGGLGDVTENKNIVLSDIMGEKLSAVHHANGEDVWVVVHTGSLDLPGNIFKAFLITAEGVSEPVESSIGDIVGWSLGQMKMSPDGKKIAVVNGAAGISVFLQVFDFDDETGIISNPVTLTSAIDLGPMEFMYGLEFSPNSRFLYFNETNFGDNGKLHQLDLDAGSEAEIVASDVILSDVPAGGLDFRAMQVGPDGKIYFIKQAYGMTISVINNPNNKGVDANLQDSDIMFFGGLGEGLPGFIQSYFESGILFEGGSCPGEEITFSTIRIPDVESIAWDFGDPASGTDNASAELQPVHEFSSPGTYTITATITSNGAEQMATAEVIVTAPDATIPALDSVTLCADGFGTTTFNLQNLTPEIIGEQDPTIVSVTYYANNADLANGTPINVPAAFTTSGQTIYAKVTSIATGCSIVIDFALVVNPSPQTTSPIVAPQCAANDGTAIFDLAQQQTIILGTQSPDDFTVVFYASEADMENGSPIDTPENFETSGQTIYALVTDINSGCETTVVFSLVVTPVPEIDAQDDIIACSGYILPSLSAGNAYWTGPDGTGEQVLPGQIVTENAIFYVLATSPDNTDCTVEDVFTIEITDFDVDFESGCDGTAFWLEAIAVDASFNADTATYLWSGPDFTSIDRGFAVPGAGIYTVTVTTEDGCTGEASFEVESTTCQIPRGISPNNDGMNDTFDLSDYDVRKLSIFNRYGQEVYSRNDYTNQWSGQSESNNELPTGTYFYMIERQNGESATGWVYINREE